MKKIYLIATGMVAAASASAQNLNPTVSVTRSYEGRLVEVHKPMQEMSVPDSLYKFDLDFDYSVFENPYRGAYDFKPYALDMKPEAGEYDGRKLYLKAGAGYQLRPSVDFVWQPRMKTDKFRMDVYASHHSYVGNYSRIGLDGDGSLEGTGEKWKGYDMYSRAGVDGRACLDKAVLTFDAGYLGIHTKDMYAVATGYNAADMSFRVKSADMVEKGLYYDVALKYRYASRGLGGNYVFRKSVGMNDLDFNASLGPVLSRHSRIVADFGMGQTWYGDYLNCVGTAYVTPKYVLEKNRWNVAIGVKGSFNTTPSVDGGPALNTNKGVFIYPDVHISFEVAKDYMDLYFSAAGGDCRNSYSSLVEKNHFFIPWDGMSNNSVTHADFTLGFRGNVRNRLRYDLSFGFRSFEAMPFESVHAVEADGVTDYLFGWSYFDGTAAYADVKLQWESRNFMVDSEFSFLDSNLKNHKTVQYNCFEPSFFSGHVSASYNWKKRIFAGVSAEFASKRNGMMTVLSNAGEDVSAMDSCGASVPAWVNLGIHAEYAFTRRLSFWLKADNLLDMDIQRVPLYAEGGIGFTAGICLNL